MSGTFSITLAAVVLLLFVVRLTIVLTRAPAVPGAREITRANAVMVAIAILGLTFHCAAMFYRGLVDSLPGTDDLIAMVNGMGVESLILYTIPALLLLVGLRSQNRAAVAVLAVALVAVGVTMYNGGPVTVHLITIFATVTVIAAIVALLISRVSVHRTPVAA